MALSAGGGTTIAKKVSGNAVLYTVPEGKTFEGNLWNNSTTGPGYINGIQLIWPNFSNYYALSPIPVKLNGGDIVKGDNSGVTCIVGVEM